MMLGNSRITTASRTGDRLLMHDVQLGDNSLHFQWLGGSIFYPEEMNRKALKNAEMVVYVVSTNDIGGPGFQEEKWDEYVTAAKELKATWTDVPWLFVLNKIDLKQGNPLIHRIPEEYRDQIIQTCATDGRGVDILWQRILDTVAKLG